MNQRRGFLKKLLGGGSVAVGLPLVKSIEVLQPSADELLVVKIEGCASQEQLAQVRAALSQQLPGQRVLVCDSRMDFSVIKAPQ